MILSLEKIIGQKITGVTFYENKDISISFDDGEHLMIYSRLIFESGKDHQSILGDKIVDIHETENEITLILNNQTVRIDKKLATNQEYLKLILPNNSISSLNL